MQKKKKTPCKKIIATQGNITYLVMLSKRSQVENKPMIKQDNKWAPKNIYCEQ